MKDLKGDAVVSVFLRAPKYYDGILVLTSNRVGTCTLPARSPNSWSNSLDPCMTDFHPTVDEAFKSHIQLALHYENLGLIQRKKIWRNFVSRIKTLEETSSADMEDVLNYIDELSKEVMKGKRFATPSSLRGSWPSSERKASSIHIPSMLSV
jgi:hypothetical protein